MYEEILIVDDNPDNLRLLSQLLGDRGYRLRFVTNGEQALASANLAPPDLMLLDIRMPELDGYEVCRRLKANPATRDVAVIFISALDEVGDKVQAFTVGGADYVTKPFQFEEVLARVRTHLSLRHLQRDLQEANRRMERELELASRVQRSFLSRRAPPLPGWQISVSLVPARQTSGDFYDLISLPDGRLGLVIADVADKGMAAALLMAMSSALLRTYLAEHPREPAAVLYAVNQSLLEYNALGLFVTAFLALLDPATGRFVYANAGHNPAIWIKAGQARTSRLLARTGPAIGIREESTWQEIALTLSPCDVLVLYTDGITEADDGKGEMFGMERLSEVIGANAASPAAVIQKSILDRVHAFSRGGPPADDVALVVLVRE